MNLTLVSHFKKMFQGPGIVHAASLARPTEPHKWNGALIRVISCTCAFPAVTFQNVCYGKSTAIT